MFFREEFDLIRLSAFSDEAGKDLNVQIAALQRNNIYLTELRSVGGKNVKDLTPNETREIASRLADAGIGLSALGSPMGKVNISVDFGKYLDEVKSLCETAAILGTDRVRMFSFFEAYNERSRVIEYLNRMVEVASSYKLILCHENEKHIYGDTAERVLDLKANVEGLRFVYDPANFLQVGEMPDITLPKIQPICDYFHIKDVDVKTDQLVPAGYGDGQIDKMISDINIDTMLTLEPHLKEFIGYNDIDGEVMHHKFDFKTGDDAFDFAVVSLKKLLDAAGYKEKSGGIFEK